MSLLETDTLLYPQKSGNVLLASGGLYAPTIRYNEGTFYIVCTNVLHGGPTAAQDKTENFIISTKDIWSNNWTDPVYFKFSGIDPSILFDDDGRVYIHGSRGPGPGTKINLFQVDIKTGELLSEEKTIWEGTGGIYPEGPHIYKKDGYYYVMISEGGTHEHHMITVARSRDIWGPYEANPDNPILTARGTDEYIQYTGHCDAFQDKNGDWWGVCLGVRRDKSGRFIMGRESFLTRCTWDEGQWPVFDRVTANPSGLSRQGHVQALTSAPMADYLYIRDVDQSRYEFSGKSDVTLHGSGIDLTDKALSPVFVGKRQRVLTGSASVTCSPKSGSWPKTLRAGLASYKDEHRFTRIYYDAGASAVVFELKNFAKKIHKTSRKVIDHPDRIIFTLEYAEDEYRLLFRTDRSSDSNECLAKVDTLDLTGPDFVGPVIGVFALAEGEDTEVEFKGLDID